MIIESLNIYKLNIPYHKPLKVAIGEVHKAENVVIKIVTHTQLVGWGEATPRPYITGETQHTNYETAQKLAKLLKGKDPLAIDKRIQQMEQVIVNESSIRSAFDMALYDIAAKAANMPLYQFLGGSQRPLRTDLTIGIQDSVEETVTQAKAIISKGFNAIKIKVGRQGLADIPHVAAVRELVGPNIEIKIDSNQGWDYPTAVANISAMRPLNLQYSEQPLPAWDNDNLMRLRNKIDLPLCADESVFNHHDALGIVNRGAVDYINIKLGKSGGINTALKINAIAEAAGCKCMIGCFSESRLALSAAAHLAMAKPNIVFLDLDSALDYKIDPVIGGMTYDKSIGGLIHLGHQHGHGATFDESMLSDLLSM